MLFTWNYKNLCIIFSWWHIRSLLGLVFSLLLLVLISAGYEWLKYKILKYEKSLTGNALLPNTPSTGDIIKIQQKKKIINSFLYGLQVGYSFMLMLVFMTYNGWAMISVVVGAILGKYLWNTEPSLRSIACH
ncbi:low-affinity Cu transporter [Ascoidea rubescens DSM 1968]|uniref:Copper transport protein n=1 Tax=Ascoidea rubescens DSM 1968 TaxID=1344418 RepID=A0A1D2VCG4_9ASCO|nr:ctr copper transporter [Ascoidea rubescens DSM 1968]ODV59326.1 ctr copper transporter [Ascoidea rubescens DSM 1968]